MAGGKSINGGGGAIKPLQQKKNGVVDAGVLFYSGVIYSDVFSSGEAAIGGGKRLVMYTAF
ncbi:hypothetical protein CRG98_003850 [Punica granatum]|uniref:Uncharacterized protein n=1 Tax=Punica granatum TaxID=22663 RepID=A0A2I0L4Y5_PUNGR|nr:hypothetical protein CRG98_003850 [Punica granatum]